MSPAPAGEGVPKAGDRSARDTHTYDHLHASDIAENEHLVHLPLPGAAGGLARSNGTYWVRVDEVTPHDEVTLSAEAADILAIVGQELDLDTQVANTVLAGPASGAAAKPTMRALVNADLPDPLAFRTAASILTIAAGAVTATQNVHAIAAESGTEDDLDTITAAASRTLVLLQADTGDTITVKHGTGNVSLNGAADFELSGNKALLLYWTGSAWVDLGAGGGGGGAGTDEKAKVSANDTTAGYLNGKLVAGAGISLTEGNDGGDETLTVATDLASAGGTKMLQTHTVLHSETLAAAGRFDVSGISQDYDHLIVRILARGTVADTQDAVRLFFNNDTTLTNYRYGHQYAGTSTGSGAGDDTPLNTVPADTSTADDYGIIEVHVPNYAGSKRKGVLWWNGHRRTASNIFVIRGYTNWENTDAINRITVQPDGYDGDKFAVGSYIEVIGVREEAVGGAAVSTADVSSPPTDAELDAAFGTPATVGAGFLGLVDDAGAGSAVWLAASDGTYWWYQALTKAV